MASVDVFVPCYNYGRFLEECVRSVLNQDGVDVRVLIIDDASSDDTPEVGRALAAADPRVGYRRHTANRGHIATYNEGLEWTSGDYLLLLSADDMLTPGALARAAGLMDHHPEVGFTFGRCIKTERPIPGSAPSSRHCCWRILSGEEFLALSCRLGGNMVPVPTLVTRTELQKRIGFYRADLPHTGDLEICLRLAAHASVGVLDADQGFYRVHGQNMHKQTYTDGWTILEQHREAFWALFEDYGARLTDLPGLKHSAERALALGALYRACKAFDAGDLESCERFLAYAARQHPPLQREANWRRLSVKRAMGPTVWKVVRPLYRMLRHRPALDPSPFVTSGIFPGV